MQLEREMLLECRIKWGVVVMGGLGKCRGSGGEVIGSWGRGGEEGEECG